MKMKKHSIAVLLVFLAYTAYISISAGAQDEGSKVIALSAVDEVEPGDTVTLSMKVRNAGSGSLTSRCEAWFKVSGPGMDSWVGYEDCGRQPGESTRKYSYRWKVPLNAKPGLYTYRGRVYDHASEYTPLSGFSDGNFFRVVRGSASTPLLYQTDDARPGDTVTFSARVRNAGDISLGAGCEVWFKIAGQNVEKWAGYSDCSRLTEYSEKRYSVDWKVPADMKAGRYDYWCRVYSHVGGEYIAISDWSASRSMQIIRGSAEISSLQGIESVSPGDDVSFSARVRNTGDISLGAGCEVWFKVECPGVDEWVGPAGCGGLAVYSSKRYYATWKVATDASRRSCTYWGRVYEKIDGVYYTISDWSGAETFKIL